MDHRQDHSQNPSMGLDGSEAQATYGSNPYQSNQITGSPGMVVAPVGTIQSTGQPAGAELGQDQLAYQHIHQQHQAQQGQDQLAYQHIHQQHQAQLGQDQLAYQDIHQQHQAQLGQDQLAYQHIHQQHQQLQEPAGAQLGQDQLAYQHIHQQHQQEQQLQEPAGAQQEQDQLAYQYEQIHQQHQREQQQLQQRLQALWANQYQEIEKVTDFKNHSIPLARIKKIMKADEDVRMISAEAPVIFARACELFVSELTLRSWIHTEENRRRTLQKNDVLAAIKRTDILDFLIDDMVTREELKDEVFASVPIGTMPVPAGPSDSSIPYFSMPPQHAPQAGTSGVIMGNPAMDPNMHAQQPHPYMAPHVGISGAIMGNPAMEPNIHAEQPHPFMAPQVGTSSSGAIMGNAAMEPNVYAQQPHAYMSPQGGTSGPGVLMGNPAMESHIYAQQPHPYTAPEMWPQPPEQQQSPPHAPQVGTAGVMMGNPAMEPNIHAQQPHPYMAPQMWPQPPEQQQSPPDH